MSDVPKMNRKPLFLNPETYVQDTLELGMCQDEAQVGSRFNPSLVPSDI